MPGLISPGFACLAARRWGFGSDDLVISAGFLLLGLKFKNFDIFSLESNATVKIFSSLSHSINDVDDDKMKLGHFSEITGPDF